MERTYKLILTASEIPLEAKVTKRTGTKMLTLRRKITIWDQSGGRKEIFADNGCFFLIGDDGSISAIAGNTVLIWFCDIFDLQQYLHAQLDNQLDN